MTNEELITNIVKENYELKKDLNSIYDYSNDILGNLYCVGGGLNDNIKNYTKDQMKDLFRIADLAKFIKDLSEKHNES